MGSFAHQSLTRLHTLNCLLKVMRFLALVRRNAGFDNQQG
jgi:hypothetical protein